MSQKNDNSHKTLGVFRQLASFWFTGSGSVSCESSEIPLELSWLLLGIVTLIFGAPSLLFPFGRDQLCYAFFGEAILQGKVLYRDIPMMQMPLTGAVHSLAMLLFGHSMTSIRIVDLFWTFAVAGFLFLLVRRMVGRDWVALIAAMLYPAAYFTHNYWNTAQVDEFLNLPVAAGLYFAFRAMTVPGGDINLEPMNRNTRLQLVLAGVLLGLALLFKYTILLIIPGLFLIVLLFYRQDCWRGGRIILWMTLGIAIPLVVFVVILAICGGLGDFISDQIHVALPYSKEGNSRLSLLSKIGMFSNRYLYRESSQVVHYLGLIGLFFAVGSFLRPSSDAKLRRGFALVVMWLAAALFSTFIQGKFFIYHYLVLEPPLAILSAFALSLMLRPVGRLLPRIKQRLVLLGVVLVAFILLTVHSDRYWDLLCVSFGEESLDEYWLRDKYQDNTFHLKERLALADYLEQSTKKTDRVACFGIDPWLSFPVWREPSLRYTATLGQDPRKWTMHPEFMAKPPEVIVIPHGDKIPWVRGHNLDSYEQTMVFTEMRDFVAANYKLATRIGRLDIMRRINTGSVGNTANTPSAVNTTNDAKTNDDGKAKNDVNQPTP
jgi:hypothetical protein